MDDVDRELLDDMLRHALLAIHLLGSMKFDDFVADPRTLFSVLHLAQIVGEAAFQISKSGRTELTELPWTKIVGMRHHIVHGYRKVDEELLFETVRDDFPELIAALQGILAKDRE